MNGTKLNNEKDRNDFNEEDYVVMTSYLPSKTDTYEIMTKNALPVVTEEKQNTPVAQDKVRLKNEPHPSCAHTTSVILP